MLLAERQLAHSPDLRVLQLNVSSNIPLEVKDNSQGSVSTYRLKVPLDLRVQRACLEGNDLRSGIGIMGNGRATFRAEDAVDVEARRSLAGVPLDRALDDEFVLGDDGD